MPKGKLSKRQAAIYEYICSYTDQHGYPPSVREIGAAVNLASPSTVHMHLKVLEQFGLIDRDPKKPRTMKIVPQASNTSDAAKLAPVTQDVANNVISLPLVDVLLQAHLFLLSKTLRNLYLFQQALLEIQALSFFAYVENQ